MAGMVPNPYAPPLRVDDDPAPYEPPWGKEVEKSNRKKWAKGAGIAAAVVFLTPFVGLAVLWIAHAIELVVYVIYRLMMGE